MIILAVILFISYIEIFLKANRKIWEALIPFYNIYVFTKIIDIHIIIVIILAILILFPLTSKFFLLLVIINLPFILADAFGYSMVYGFLGLVLPIIFIPIIAFKGTYLYDTSNVNLEENLDKLVSESLKRHQ